MDRVNKAVEYYMRDFCCAQGVFAAYATETGMDEKTALKIGTVLGGGARKGEICGAVSGALMVIGLRYGYCEESDIEGKMRARGIAERYLNRFIEKNGSVVCRQLLGYDLTRPDERAKIEERDLFHTMCPELVRSAAQLLEEIIAEEDSRAGLNPDAKAGLT